MSAIAINRLRVVRGGNVVLPGLDLDVPDGVVTGLLGPSGSGKTTLMRAIVGVQVVEAGRVEVLGLPAGTAALRTRVGYVTQAPSLYADLSYFGRIAAAQPARVDDVIAVVDLGAVADHQVRRLSGGERSRASLAAALLGRPEVLVLDEPTVGLDPVLRRDLWHSFHALADEGATVLVSSHVMDEAERCDHLLLMREGRILAAGSPASLLERSGMPDLEATFLALVEST
jgi:ABC-2 type transport system ATP-binding protein